MNANQAVGMVPPRRRWKWTRRLGGALLLIVLVAAGLAVMLYVKSGFDLDAAIAEADRLDPGWRLEEIEGRRAQIADADNAAVCVEAADKLLPSRWPSWIERPFQDRDDLAKSLAEVPPGALLNDVQSAMLKEACAKAAKARKEARKLVELPQGHFAVRRDRQGLPVPAWISQPVVDLMYYHALMLAQEEDLDGALAFCRGYLNVARSIGDEPHPFSQQRRLELRASMCRLVERVLAQGEASEASLAALQKLLEDEETQPVFLYGARGLRVWLDELLDGVGTGRVQALLPGVFSTGFAANVRPVTLRMTTRLVEAAKLPVEEQRQALDAGASPKSDEGPYLARVFIVPKIQHTGHHLSHGQIETQAELRSTIVALAAERHRLALGEWPATVAALVPAFLRAAPTDPFDRQPVRYRKRADGVAIYCIGLDGADNDGRIDRGARGPGIRRPPGADLGVQLWDVDKRRQVPVQVMQEPHTK